MQTNAKRTGNYEAPRIEFETLIADTIMCSGETPKGMNDCGHCDYMVGKHNKNCIACPDKGC